MAEERNVFEVITDYSVNERISSIKTYKVRLINRLSCLKNSIWIKSNG